MLHRRRKQPDTHVSASEGSDFVGSAPEMVGQFSSHPTASDAKGNAPQVS
jgi:hypothetical protein